MAIDDQTLESEAFLDFCEEMGLDYDSDEAHAAWDQERVAAEEYRAERRIEELEFARMGW